MVGDLAYVGEAPTYWTGILRIIDVSNPAFPVELGALVVPGFAGDVEVVGDLAYVAGFTLDDLGFSRGWLRIIDVSDPALPVELCAFDTLGEAADVEVVGDLAYVADGSGLRVIDVSNPALPVEIGALDTPGSASDVELVGDLAYVTDEFSGLHVIDVSDPTFPVEFGNLWATEWACGRRGGGRPGLRGRSDHRRTARDRRLRPLPPGGARRSCHAGLGVRRGAGGQPRLRGR